MFCDLIGQFVKHCFYPNAFLPGISTQEEKEWQPSQEVPSRCILHFGGRRSSLHCVLCRIIVNLPHTAHKLFIPKAANNPNTVRTYMRQLEKVKKQKALQCSSDFNKVYMFTILSLRYSQVVGEVVLLLDVDVEAVGDLVEIVLADAADEAVVAQVVLHALHHVAQRAERVDDET